MYWWMDKWLRGKDGAEPAAEGEVKTLQIKKLLDLKVSVSANKGFAHISHIYTTSMRYAAPNLADRKDWKNYRGKMLQALRNLLGAPLPPQGAAKLIGSEKRGGLVIERVLCPSDGPISVPALVLRPAGRSGKLPVTVICSGRGKATALAAEGNDSPAALARSGRVVVLPDVRFVGELSLGSFAGLSAKLMKFQAASPLGEGRPASFEGAWRRNAMLWGRPIDAMAATDILAVLNYIATRKDVEQADISLVGRGRSAIPALFAAVLDTRIGSLDVDLASRCFADRGGSKVPFILRHGDVLQWAALIADRKLKLTSLSKAAGDPKWLKDAFTAAGNSGGVRL